MNRYVNHRGWIVVDSVAMPGQAFCVDLFEHPGGGFGFEHFRIDSEDMGRWTPLGGSGNTRYPTASDAATAARQSVAWLADHRFQHERGQAT